MLATTPADQLYESDFYAWSQLQARELRRFARLRPNVPIDLPHVAEEIADLGKEVRNGLRSHARQVIVHLLLLQHSPARDARRGWQDEIDAWRLFVADRLSPTLERDLRRQLPRLFAAARGLADRKLRRHGEDGAADALPATCPYALEQVIGDWWPPEPPGG